jgi:hypothetical protein
MKKKRKDGLKVAKKEIERVIKLLEAEAVHMVEAQSRHEGSSRLKHYFSGREAGILLALDHLKKMNVSER